MTMKSVPTTTMIEETSSPAARLPLRICCYGSSSSRTPEKYTSAAYQLGQILAIRGHTCVNGAGSAGCMAAMNQGAHDHRGHIVGVIHEKFVVDGSDWFEGAHSVFANKNNKDSGGGAEILIARGNDLQERKRLLVEGADALVVLPGGPGTWDELWEMACARHVGFHSMPIVCVNVDGYYDSFKAILSRAHTDELLYKHPRDILHFEETPEAAVDWIESYLADPVNESAKHPQIKKRSATMLKRLQSNVSGNAWISMSSFFGGDDRVERSIGDVQWRNIMLYSLGLSGLGFLFISRMSSGSKRS